MATLIAALSTTTPIGAGASWTSSYADLTGYIGGEVSVNVDTNSTLVIEYSMDMSTVDSQGTNIMQTSTQTAQIYPKTKYVRITVINRESPTPQTVTRVQTFFFDPEYGSASFANVGGFDEVYVTGSNADFRTIQSSDSSVTIQQHTNDLDLVVTNPSVWEQTGYVVSPVDVDCCVIAGGHLNTITSDYANATLGGDTNAIKDNTGWSSICGGYYNTIDDGDHENESIVGGHDNTISGNQYSGNGSIVGGFNHTINITSSGPDISENNSIIGGHDCNIQTSENSSMFGCADCDMLYGSGNAMIAADTCGMTGDAGSLYCLVSGLFNNINNTTGGSGYPYYSTILGGTFNVINNRSSANTILGGYQNTVSATRDINNSAILGGYNHNLTGVGSGELSEGYLLGGRTNTLTLTSGDVLGCGIIGGRSCSITKATDCGIITGNGSTISGTGLKTNCLISGLTNSISGTSAINQSAILGGESNVISSSAGTASDNIILGGNGNAITGTVVNCCVGGGSATAAHTKSFVWNNGNALSTTTGSQWLVNATGGSKFFSNAGATTGVSLAAGGTSWAVISDENVKDNLVALDTEEISDLVQEIPLYRYNYKDNPAEQYCYGMCAQDWHAKFPYPDIVTLDAEGVEVVRESKDKLVIETGDMIGILYACVQQARKDNDDLRSRIIVLEKMLGVI